MKKKTAFLLVLILIILISSILLIIYGGYFKTGSFQTEKTEYSLDSRESSAEDYIDSSASNVMSTSDTISTLDASDSIPDIGSISSFDSTKEETFQSYEPAGTTPLSKEYLRSLVAGTIIDDKIGIKNTDLCFYYEEIKEDIKLRIYGKSYKEDCTVPYEDLRYVRVLYYGFDSNTHIGELIVNKAIASDIVQIFIELYNEKYPLESMVLVDEYEADDNASMAANNTSAFNYRTVPDSSNLSNHALGLAIDINPLYNPYVVTKNGKTTILPEEGAPYADRSLDCPYYIKENDICYKTFTKYGFTWGGLWNSSKDYQHFEKEIEETK